MTETTTIVYSEESIGLISDFLAGVGKDSYGRSYGEIILWDDDQLEECHDHIQWAFPLHEGSAFAKEYPIITPGMIDKMKEHNLKWKMIQSNIRLMAERMAHFYGFNLTDDNKQNFTGKRMGWMVVDPPDHNLLRITRIIRCLQLFEMEDLADKFHNRVKNKVLMNTKEPSKWEKTFKYWWESLTYHKWNSLK